MSKVIICNYMLVVVTEGEEETLSAKEQRNHRGQVDLDEWFLQRTRGQLQCKEEHLQKSKEIVNE